jgi:hypothetical protein
MTAEVPAAREPEVWTRVEAIVELRTALLDLCGEGRSMCRVAAERGIFCRGFGRWPEREFHERWKLLIGVSTHLSRAQMERLADIWQLGEQLQHRVALICDAQTMFPGACRGWDEFSNADLARFCGEILERPVVVTDGQPIASEIAPERPNVLDTDWRAGVSFDTNGSRSTRCLELRRSAP